jgi:hypothetical protein
VARIRGRIMVRLLCSKRNPTPRYCTTDRGLPGEQDPAGTHLIPIPPQRLHASPGLNPGQPHAKREVSQALGFITATLGQPEGWMPQGRLHGQRRPKRPTSGTTFGAACGGRACSGVARRRAGYCSIRLRSRFAARRRFPRLPRLAFFNTSASRPSRTACPASGRCT